MIHFQKSFTISNILTILAPGIVVIDSIDGIIGTEATIAVEKEKRGLIQTITSDSV